MLLRWRLFWERTKRLRRIIGNCTITVNDFSDRNQEGTGTLCLGGLGTLSETIEGGGKHRAAFHVPRALLRLSLLFAAFSNEKIEH